MVPSMRPPPASSALGKDDMCCRVGGHVLGAPIAKLWGVDASKKVFPGAEQDRGNGKMHLVDQSRTEVLPDRRGAAHKLDVFTVGSFGGALQGSVNTLG